MKFVKQKITTINDTDIFKIQIINDNNFSIEFYNYGGYIHSINIPYLKNNSLHEDVLLGYDSFDGYKTDKDYINALVGRVCGRITNSKFQLNNEVYNVFPNDDPHHLHGGKEGFNKKIWKIESLFNDNNSCLCKMSYTSKHMEEQYPGILNCLTTYKFYNNNQFEIVFEAFSDRDTIVNLTNHNYWNFHGHNEYYGNIIDHIIKVNSNQICEIDKEQVPSGTLIDVKNTKFDLRNNTKIDHKILENDGIDHCYKINAKKKLIKVASIFSNRTKMGMDFYTDQPGLQIYTGNMMADSYSGKYNKKYGRQYGICLEAQIYPDAINHSNFISPILKANEKYSSKIIMKFKNDF